MDDTTKGTGGEAAGDKKSTERKGTGKAAPAARETGARTAKPRASSAGSSRRAAETSAGAERWLFAVVGAGDVAADTIRHTAERTRVMLTGGRKGAASTTSAAVDRLAVRGRTVVGEVAGSDGVQAMTRRAEIARKRFGTLSTSLSKAASNAVEAGKAFRRAS
jgi:hypothetical protein